MQESCFIHVFQPFHADGNKFLLECDSSGSNLSLEFNIKKDDG